MVCPETTRWRSALRPFKHWRVTVHRSGATHGFKSPDIIPDVGEAIALVGACALSDDCTAGPQVNLVNADVEVIAYLSDGIDELRVASGERRKDLARGSEFMALGTRSAGTRGRQLSLGIEKGAVLSRADDTVALCVAQRAVD